MLARNQIIQVARLVTAGKSRLSRAQRSCISVVTSRHFNSSIRPQENTTHSEQNNAKPVSQTKPKSKYSNKLFDQVKSKNLGKLKKEPDAIVYELKKDTGTSIMANTLFTLAAFPVHAWGFMTLTDKHLLFFPLAFSIMWLYYSIKKAHSRVKRLTFVSIPVDRKADPKQEDSKTYTEYIDGVQITTYTAMGRERSVTVPRLQIKPLLDNVDQSVPIRHFKVMEKTALPYLSVEENSSIEKANTNKSSLVRATQYSIDLKKGETKRPDLFTLFLHGM